MTKKDFIKRLYLIADVKKISTFARLIAYAYIAPSLYIGTSYENEDYVFNFSFTGYSNLSISLTAGWVYVDFLKHFGADFKWDYREGSYFIPAETFVKITDAFRENVISFAAVVNDILNNFIEAYSHNTMPADDKLMNELFDAITAVSPSDVVFKKPADTKDNPLLHRFIVCEVNNNKWLLNQAEHKLVESYHKYMACNV